MHDRADNTIATQALKAMRLRRQFESGELTHQEYLARLEGLEGISNSQPAPEPQSVTVTARETDGGKSRQMATEPRPRLVGAQEMLRLRRSPENGRHTPTEDPLQSESETYGKNEPGRWRPAESPQKPELGSIPLRKELVPADQQPDPEFVRQREPEPPVTIASTPASSMLVAQATVTAKPAVKQPSAQKPRAAALNLTSGWRRPPRSRRLVWVLAALGGTFVLVAALQPLGVRGFTGLSRKGTTAQEAAILAPAPEVLPADLTVAEAGLIGQSPRRRIAGVLKNRSDKTYSNIDVTFSLVGPDGDTLGEATATVDRIGGHETARFEASGANPAAELIFQRIETHSSMPGTP